MATDKIESILGKEVKSPTGESMGRIVDIIVDRSVTVRGAVIDFGGFLGVGSRQIAVAWKALRFSQQNKSNVLIVDFTKDQLKAAPAYKAGEQVVLLHPPASPPAPTDTSAPSAPANPPAQAVPPETPAK
ncbi:MAG: PRC-barrel domain-containing protein [Afipia felis]|nr:PRC-barrel domain-containing protein [Afipia felis]